MIGEACKRVFLVPAVLAPILALPGCMTTHLAPVSPARWHSHALVYGSVRLPCARWWQCLGDVQLSALIERAAVTALSPQAGQDWLAAEIARRYIALRARQTALVLLAEQENLDSQLLAIGIQRFGRGAASRQTIEAAQAQLADTRAMQTRTRAQIASLRIRLAVLAGAALGSQGRMPGGPIPLPPAIPVSDDSPATMAALADYQAIATAAAAAQSAAIGARAVAARLAPARVADTAALQAARRALAALQTEERAREVWAQAYVVLAESQSLAAAPH